MGTAQLREELHQFINEADDRILNLVYAMMKADSESKDEALEASIDRALEQSARREVRTHEEVMKGVRTHYKS